MINVKKICAMALCVATLGTSALSMSADAAEVDIEVSGFKYIDVDTGYRSSSEARKAAEDYLINSNLNNGLRRDSRDYVTVVRYNYGGAFTETFAVNSNDPNGNKFVGSNRLVHVGDVNYDMKIDRNDVSAMSYALYSKSVPKKYTIYRLNGVVDRTWDVNGDGVFNSKDYDALNNFTKAKTRPKGSEIGYAICTTTKGWHCMKNSGRSIKTIYYGYSQKVYGDKDGNISKL